MKDSLFDASALLNLLRNKESRSIKILDDQHVLDLTLYEVSNAIWKLSYRENKLTREQSRLLLDSILTLLSRMQTNNIKGLEKHVYDLSTKEGLTIYDASYLAVAERSGLVLVTDDLQLAKSARKYVKTIKSDDL